MPDKTIPDVLTREACANVFSWMHEEPEPMRWLLDQWIPEGCFGVFKAKGGIGKSNLVNAMCLSLAAKMVIGPFRPWDAAPRRVLIINGEDASKAQKRRLFFARKKYQPDQKQLALCKQNLLIYPARNTIGPLMKLDAQGNPVPTEYMAWLKESVTALDPDLVILDTKSRFFGLPDENSNPLNSAFVRAIEAAVVTDTRSCLVVHHTGKVSADQEMSADGGRGGSSTGDDARFIIAAADISKKEARRLGLDPEAHFVARPVKQSYGKLAPAAYFRREEEGIPVHITPTDKTTEALVSELTRWLKEGAEDKRVTRREFQRGEKESVKKLRASVAKKYYRGKKNGVAQDLLAALEQALETGKVVITQNKGSSPGFITLVASGGPAGG